jgi:hypothetical protein
MEGKMNSMATTKLCHIKHARFIRVALPLLTLLCLSLGCSVSGDTSSASDPILEKVLSARNEKEFNEAYVQHGAIREDELQAIYKATGSSTDYRRLNAAKLLRTTTKGNAIELEHKALMETKDVVVWAIMLDALLEKEPELAGKRPEMIKAALERKDGETLGVGLRAGALSNYPGIRETARKYLDSPDEHVRAAAVSGLTVEDVRELQTRLADMLLKEKDEDTFILLAKALIRTHDTNAATVVVQALEKLKQDNDSLSSHFFNSLTFSAPDATTDRFLFTLAQSSSPVHEEGLGVLTTQVWANKREPMVELVQLCSDKIEKGTLDINPRRQPPASKEQTDCEEMLSFMETGKNPISDFDSRRIGKNALGFGRKWLKEHGGASQRQGQ